VLILPAFFVRKEKESQQERQDGQVGVPALGESKPPYGVKDRAGRSLAAEILPRESGMTVAFTEGVANRGRYITNSSGGYMAKDLEQRGLENQVKGTAKEVKGQVRGDIGDMTDNESEQVKGRVEEVKGKIQKNFGKAEREIDEST
jgi:uncharacterized protein YjbJ (UPF0337 family)